MNNYRYHLFLVMSVFISMIFGIWVSPYVMSDISKTQLGLARDREILTYIDGATSIKTSIGTGNNINDMVLATQNALPSVVTVSTGEKSNSLTSSLDRSRYKENSVGSGFIVNANGFIITSKHVVSDPELTYRVIDNNGEEYKVGAIIYGKDNDLALIKVDALNLKPIPLGDSSNLKLGQTVLAIGTPLGQFNNSVTSGIISGLNRGIAVGSYEEENEILTDVIQTDAAINLGNSGGPLIDTSGQVIGINTAMSSSGQNIGFAVPVNTIKAFLESIKAS